MNENCVLALGFFDGVHLGHRAVIAEAVKQARAQNGKGAVFTFEPPHHTDRAVSKSDVKLLQSPESRDRVWMASGCISWPGPEKRWNGPPGR